MRSRLRLGLGVAALAAVLVCGSPAIRSARAQTLTNGWDQRGTLLLASTNTHTFYATNGDAIHLRAGAPGFRPLVTVHAPSGAALGAASGAGSASLDAHTEFIAPTNGVFSVRLSSYYRNAAGDYTLALARVPAAFQTSLSDEGGRLTNAAPRSGRLDLGDMDMWSFTAKAGGAILVRAGASGFRPLLHVYGPDGSEIGQNAGGGSSDTDALVQATAASDGVYTVLVQSYYANGTGTYDLHLATPGQVAPGEFPEWLVNGASQAGQITMGGIDYWIFEAAAGEHITLRVGSPDFRPSLRVYGPGGKLLQEASGTSSVHDAAVSLITTNAGVFSAVVQSFYFSRTSSYRIHLGRVNGPFATSPGDEGGILTNGLAHAGTNTLGDLDLYSFFARAGDSIALRLGAPGYRPDLRLFGPDGALLQIAEGNSSSRDASVFLRATNTGSFTVLAQSYYYDGTGPYALSFGLFPGSLSISTGDDGGMLTNGSAFQGTISLGDLDPWSFGVCKGSTIILTCEKLSGDFTPRLRLFAPNGSLLRTVQSASMATLSYRATNSGLYTLLVDSGVANGSGTYLLTGVGIQGDGLILCPPVLGDAGVSLSGYGGEPNKSYILLGSTNLAVPRVAWPPVLTNQFDALGTFDTIWGQNPTDTARFFLLRVP